MGLAACTWPEARDSVAGDVKACPGRCPELQVLLPTWRRERLAEAARPALAPLLSVFGGCAACAVPGAFACSSGAAVAAFAP